MRERERERESGFMAGPDRERQRYIERGRERV